MVGNEQIPAEIYRKSKLKGNAADAAKSGIQLYRPQKKGIKLTKAARPVLEVPAKSQLRSQSARLQTAEEEKQQQQKLTQIQLKNKELFSQTNQFSSTNPRFVSSGSSANTKPSTE